MNFYAMFFTLFLHLLVIFSLLWHFESVDADNKEKLKQQKQMVGKVDVKVLDEDIYNHSVSCEHYYDGIGLKLDLISGEVIDAPITLPAYKAGVRKGDVINLEELFGVDRPLGYRINLHLVRKGVKLIVHPIISKICDET